MHGRRCAHTITSPCRKAAFEWSLKTSGGGRSSGEMGPLLHRMHADAEGAREAACVGDECKGENAPGTHTESTGTHHGSSAYSKDSNSVPCYKEPHGCTQVRTMPMHV